MEDKEKLRSVMSELGKKSAKAREKIHDKAYYSMLGKRSVIKRNANKAKRLEEEKRRNSPLNIVANMLTGKIAS